MANENAGPALEATVHEVQGRFPNDAALQDGIRRLGLAGFDRADLSVPEDHTQSAASELQADGPVDGTDKQQLRTMGTSMAGFAGAAAVAAATIATGGALGVAALAAGAVGAGAAAAAGAAGSAADQAQVDERDRKGAAGTLVLAVRIRSGEQVQPAVQAMKEAGATATEMVTRSDQALTRGISAASWTGG